MLLIGHTDITHKVTFSNNLDILVNNIANVLWQLSTFYVLTPNMKTVGNYTFLTNFSKRYKAPYSLSNRRDAGQTDALCRRSAAVRTEFARRAFSVAGPTVYNTLPANIRLWHSVDSFKRHLKAHLFKTLCAPPSASVSKDTIEMLAFSFLVCQKVTLNPNPNQPTFAAGCHIRA